MARRFLMFVLVLLGFSFVSMPVSAMTMEEAARKFEAMDWLTEEYPPYNFKGNDGQPSGISIDILMAAFSKIGVNITPADIKIYPWNRSYKRILKKPGTALFGMTYSPERKQVMKFVGPFVPSRVSLMAPKKSKISAHTASEISQLRIGVVRDDVGDQLVRRIAMSDELIKRKNSMKQLLYLLGSGKLDVVSYNEGVFLDAVKRSGGNPEDYESVFLLNESHLGYAFHNSTDPAVLTYLQKAIDELQADGTIKKIIGKYSQ